MKAIRLFLFAVAIAAAPSLSAQTTSVQPAAPNPQIDYDGFLALAAKLQPVRDRHRLERDTFLERVAQEGALLLDTRSAAAFAQGHIEGAVNLPFSDFTEEKLRAVIGDDPDRAIYIYCNNNFSDDVAPIMAKSAPLALNIPTFINLHGYGYANVWELAGVMPTSDVPWVASAP